MKTLRLRHYGASKYDPNQFAPIKDRNWVKPYGGLWTSPIDSKWGWKDWCNLETYANLTVYFDLEFIGNVFIIDNIYDLENFDWKLGNISYYPSFEKIVEKGFDAIHLTEKGMKETHLSEPYNLYGWDCESVLVMNKNCLKEI